MLFAFYSKELPYRDSKMNSINNIPPWITVLSHVPLLCILKKKKKRKIERKIKRERLKEKETHEAN